VPHVRKFSGWRNKYRWDSAEIERIYGGDRVEFITASKGDIIVADTTGFHRGVKPLGADRSMLTVDYLAHEENKYGKFGRDRAVRRPYRTALAAASFGRLSTRQRAAADFMNLRTDAAPSIANTLSRAV
jgi:hypothetical protein